MQIMPASMDIPGPNIRPELPQSVPDSHIMDTPGSSKGQLLPADISMDISASEEWQASAQAQLEDNLMAYAETPGSSRTRPVRRTTQPTSFDAESAAITTKPKTKRSKAPTKRKRLIRQINIVCTVCHRGNSPSNNFIVLCDGCDRPWHQKCHSPNIANEVVQIADMDWFCNKCNPNQPRQSKTKMPPTKKPGRAKITMPPQTVNRTYSEEERRAYLSSLSHDALVQLLLQISKEWPLVPIFPPGMQMAPVDLNKITDQPHILPDVGQTQSPAAKSTSESLFPLASLGARTPARISYAESSGSDPLTDGESDTQSRLQSPVPSQGVSHHGHDYDSEDYRTYPEAGQGFHLPMSVNDLDIMAEDEHYPTFSHSIRGPHKIPDQILNPFAQRQQ
ncbi:unnamed protein product [Penicillium olsonii]|uniref:PHD-type domain-containing protein n=1 Tax=Penicillium olsonii TaxID=99116 RepID=A0A9W4HX25_PENOL|nr:unnamed protein product [Penicillium olsonii]CAG8165484.1 unnamed protein product [Penicillium olsonii]